MKKEMAEFLFKRLGSKVDELTELASYENEKAADVLSEDAVACLSMLKEIIKEVILP